MKDCFESTWLIWVTWLHEQKFYFQKFHFVLSTYYASKLYAKLIRLILEHTNLVAKSPNKEVS